MLTGTASASSGVDPTTGGPEPSSTTEPMETGSTGEPGTTGLPPQGCVVHNDCGTAYCLSFQDAPPDPLASCELAPPGGQTRFTGTVLDLLDGTPLVGATVRVTAALQAIVNPANAVPLITPVTDGIGQFDGTPLAPLNEALGILGVVEQPGYPLSINILTREPYETGNEVHDAWGVSSARLSGWSVSLAADPGVPIQSLPLVTEGGSVVVIRDAATGDRVDAATLVPQFGGGSSTIRYLEPDELTFNDLETTSTGIAVILDAGLPEDFEVIVGGVPTGVFVTTADTEGAVVITSANISNP
ncbi:MAG: hypothetical protein K0V04_42100 [Deltaproteobacteria bacterium]|nr:hypothetical protein [Deltaproteobacteria bacterium]